MWNCNQRVCGTCRYWSGRREFNFNNTVVKILENKGRCCGPYGSFKGAEVLSQSTCTKWEKSI